MADFSTIKGFTVQTLADDPKLSQALGGAWSSGTNYPTSTAGMFGAGITTANVTYGGSPSLTAANKYDGTTWTGTGALSTGRDDMSGGGTQTAAFAVGGGYPVKDQMETFDGSTWSEDNDLNTARAKLGGAGTTTSAIVAGGEPSSHTDISEKWNGTSWTEVNNLNTSRHGLAGAGASGTSAIVFGGYVSDDVANAESWDGTSWTTVGALNTARYYLAGAGIQTAAIAIGGSQNPPVIANTELWDGSAWAEGSALATAKMNMASGGTNINAMATGGGTPSATNGVEEWVAPSTVSVAQEGQVWFNSTSNVLKGYGLSAPAGTWASSPSLNTGRAYSGSAGNAPDSAMVFGGETPSATGATETYDGSAWTTVPATLNTPRTYVMSFGVTTASMCVGGTPPQTAASETWDGTSWAEGYDLNSARHSGGGAGVTTAGLVFGGGTWNQPSLHKLTEEYDGSCWAEKADLNNDHMTNINSLGLTQTAAICSSGYRFPSPAATAFTEEWNGTSWAEIADLNTARYYAGGSGSVTSGLIMGGEVPAPTFYSKVELYNGTAWTEIADMGTARAHFPGTTTNGPSSGVVIAGGGPGFQTSAETFAAGTAIKTFTGS